MSQFQVKLSRNCSKIASHMPQEIRHKISPRHGVNSHGISIMPALGAWRYLHKLIKLLDMNVTTFPPSHPVMENCRTWMVIACRVMVILLLVGFTASFIFTCSWFIYINPFLWRWNRGFFNRFLLCIVGSSWFLYLGLRSMVGAKETLTTPCAAIGSYTLLRRLDWCGLGRVCRNSFCDWFFSRMLPCCASWYCQK